MPGTIICYGDSNTFGYDPCGTIAGRYPKDIRWAGILDAHVDQDVLNCGECGREIPHTDSQIAFFLKQLESWRSLQAPVQLWIMLGSNDLIQIPRAAAEDVAARMEAFLRQVLDTDAVRSGDISLTLISPPLFQYGEWVPKEWMYRESRRIEGVYRLLAERLGIGFISAGARELPVVFDGVHLSEEGHRLLAEQLIKETGLPPAPGNAPSE